MGIFDSIFGGGSETSTNTFALDQGSQNYQNAARQQALNAADRARNAGGSFFPGYGQQLDRSMGAANQGMGMGGMTAWQGLQGGLQTGMGGYGDMMNLMQPMLDPQIAALQGQHGYLSDLSTRRSSDAATSQGAFGGARHGVAEAEGLRGIDQGYMGAIGNMYNQAGGMGLNFMNQERQRMANLGMGGMGAMYQGAGIGMQGADMQRNAAMQQAQEDMWRNQQAGGFMQQGGQVLPPGYTDTTTTETRGGSPLGGLLGLGATAAGMFFPPAGLAMGALGGLGGLGGQASQFGSQYQGDPYAGMGGIGGYGSQQMMGPQPASSLFQGQGLGGI